MPAPAGWGGGGNPLYGNTPTNTTPLAPFSPPANMPTDPRLKAQASRQALLAYVLNALKNHYNLQQIKAGMPAGAAFPLSPGLMENASPFGWKNRHGGGAHGNPSMFQQIVGAAGGQVQYPYGNGQGSYMAYPGGGSVQAPQATSPGAGDINHPNITAQDYANLQPQVGDTLQWNGHQWVKIPGHPNVQQTAAQGGANPLAGMGG